MRVADAESKGLFRIPLVPTKDIGRRECGTLFWRPTFCVEPDMTATVEPLGGPNAITAGVRPDTTVAAVATTARDGRLRAVVVFIVVVSCVVLKRTKLLGNLPMRILTRKANGSELLHQVFIPTKNSDRVLWIVVTTNIKFCWVAAPDSMIAWWSPLSAIDFLTRTSHEQKR